MIKQSRPIPLTRTELKAAKTDVWVKLHLTKARNTHDLKNSQLKALRLARDADYREKMAETKRATDEPTLPLVGTQDVTREEFQALRDVKVGKPITAGTRRSA